MNAAALLGTLDRLGFEALRVLLSVLWQSSILLGAVALLAFLLRRKAASLRQGLWAGALLLAALLPLLAWGISRLDVPQAPVAVMPVYEPPVVEFAAPVELGPAAARQPAPTPVSAPARRLSFTDYPWALAFGGYCLGGGLLLSLLVLARLRIGGWVQKGRAVADARVLGAFQSARECLGVRGRVSLKETERVRSAITIGTLRPTVLLAGGADAGAFGGRASRAGRA
jgi:hypothetical protein